MGVLLTSRQDSRGACGRSRRYSHRATPPLHKLVRSRSHSLDEPKAGGNQSMFPICILSVSRLTWGARRCIGRVHVEGVTPVTSGIRAKTVD
ncbi:hypothetical protein TorRG33x02_153510, partial [Trema orientale]